MSWGLVGAAAIGAAGTIGGGMIAADGGSPLSIFGETPASGFSFGNDPVGAALSFEDLLSIGVYDPASLRAGGPLGRIINTLNSASFGSGSRNDSVGTLAQYTLPRMQEIISNGLARGMSSEEIARRLDIVVGRLPEVERINLRGALAQSGFRTLGELAQAEISFNQSMPSQEEGQQLATLVSQGRMDARRAVAAIQSNLIAPTQQDLETETSRQFDLLARSIEERANTGGYNPAGQLQLARDQAINNALSLLSGGVTLQGGALNNALGSLAQQEAGARNTSALRTNAGTQMSGQNSQQALALAQLASQASQDRAASLGAGFAGGANTIAQAVMMSSLLDRLGNNPEGPAGGGEDPSQAWLPEWLRNG